jgi:hypothetical protein
MKDMAISFNSGESSALFAEEEKLNVKYWKCRRVGWKSRD